MERKHHFYATNGDFCSAVILEKKPMGKSVYLTNKSSRATSGIVCWPGQVEDSIAHIYVQRHNDECVYCCWAV